MKVRKLYLILLAMVILLGSACVQSQEAEIKDLSIESSDKTSTTTSTTTNTSQKKTYINDPDTLVIALDKLSLVYSRIGVFISVTQDELNKMLKEKGASYQVKFVDYTKEYFEKTLSQQPKIAGGDPFDRDDIHPRRKAYLSQMHQTSMYDGREINYPKYLNRDKKGQEQIDIITVFNRRSLMDAKYSNPYLTATKEEIFLDLSTYLDSEAGATLRKSISPGSIESLRIDGKIYALSQADLSVNALAINKSFIKKYNLKLEDLTANVSDYQAYLKEDLAEHGKPTAFLDSMSRTGNWNNINFRINCLMFDKGKAKAEVDSELFQKNYLERYKLIKDSLASPITSIDEATQISIYDSFSQSALPMWHYGKGGHQYYLIPKLECVRSLQEDLYGISSWTKNKENALDFLNRLYTDKDIANLMAFGIEGKDFELLNGRVVELESNAYRFLGSGFFDSLIASPKPYEADNKLESCLKFEQDEDLIAQRGFFMDYAKHFNTINELHSIVFYGRNEARNKILKKLSNFDYKDEAEVKEGFKDYRQILTDCGIDELIKDYNEKYQEFLRNK